MIRYSIRVYTMSRQWVPLVNHDKETKCAAHFVFCHIGPQTAGSVAAGGIAVE